MDLKINRSEEERLRKELARRTDAEATRMLRYLAMPDLSRTPESPIHELVKRLVAIPAFRSFDHVEAPEIMGTDVIFDQFDFPADHPGRSRSDTYYVDDTHVLRTHTTVMWYYWLRDKAVQARLAEGKASGALSWGKVYRKDEIDKHHMNVFHQIDGWYLCRKSAKRLGLEDLKAVLSDIARASFGPEVKYRFNEDAFPFTHPSLEMEIYKDGAWVEVLGAGVVKDTVLDNLGLDSSQWNGWAFGFGLERLAIASMALPDIRLLWSQDPRVKKQLVLGQTYREVSKYPPVVRDISFVAPKSFVPNDYFDLVRSVGDELVEEVALIDKYENDEKFGKDRMSYAYRVTYRSLERTLTGEEVDALHKKLEAATAQEEGASIR